MKHQPFAQALQNVKPVLETDEHRSRREAFEKRLKTASSLVKLMDDLESAMSRSGALLAFQRLEPWKRRVIINVTLNHNTQLAAELAQAHLKASK